MPQYVNSWTYEALFDDGTFKVILIGLFVIIIAFWFGAKRSSARQHFDLEVHLEFIFLCLREAIKMVKIIQQGLHREKYDIPLS